MTSNEKNEIRRLKNGNWYWIDRRILNLYGQKLKTSGLAVYNALAFFVNSKSQACFPTQKTIADLVGLSRRTVIRKIKQLKEIGLIRIEKEKGRCFYRLLRHKVTNETQRCDKRDTSDVTSGNTNNNKLTRNINNIVNEDKRILNFKALKAFSPKTRKELLALDVARELNDLKSIPVYLFYARKYPEGFLRSLLGEVKEIPIAKIKKGRAALFNYLIKKYAKENFKDHRH